MKLRHARGFSLIELVVAITIAGIAATTIMGMLSFVAMRSSEVMLAHQATNIAAAYLHEIVAQPYAAAGGCNDSRQNANEVCDYNGLNDIGARDRLGTPILGLEGYGVQVQVGSPSVLGAATARLIIVTVTDPVGAQTVMSSYKVAP